MTRRSGMPADSLELLLDTICNTFGGIIFIALLVVVLLMISGKPGALPGEASPEEASESLAKRNQLENLQRLKTRLESNLEKQTKIVSTLTQNDLPQSLASYQLELDRHSELETDMADLQRRILRTEKEDEEMSRKRKELQPQLAAIELQAVELKQSLADQKASLRKTLRMPVLKSPGEKQELLLVMQFNRLYFWHQYSSSGDREGLNTNDFLILSEDDNGVVTSPNPIAGIPVDSTNESQQRLIRSLNRFRPSGYYLAIVVRPDSYGAFQYLRDAAVASGHEYRLVPATSEERYVDRGGKGGFVQ